MGTTSILKMNSADVAKQLNNMVAFINQEAEEKASEIIAKAKEDTSILRAQLQNAGKRKIQKEFDQKQKAIEVQRKIAYSNELNQSRLSVLKTREECVQKILTEALDQLGSVSQPGPEYEALLKKLLIQGLMKIGENDVTVACRKHARCSATTSSTPRSPLNFICHQHARQPIKQ